MGLSLPPLATLPVLVNRFPTSSAEELNTKPQSDLPTVDNLGCGPLASAVLDRGLEAETPAEAKDALAQLHALLDVHESVAVALLEPRQVLLFWGRVRGCASEWIARRRYPWVAAHGDAPPE